MRALGYVYVAEYEPWLPNEMLFRKGPPGPWTHHAHMMETTCPRWEEFTLVRDYLRRHEEVASAYADLKRAPALVFEDDIAGYRTAKAPFSEGATRRAATEAVDKAVDRWVWYAGWADKLAQVFGSANPVAGPYFNFSVPEPTGVVGVVAPAGSSLLGLVSRLAPVIVSGNTAV